MAKKNQVNQVAKSEHLIPFAKFHRGVKIQINQDRPRSIPCFGAYRCKHRCHSEVPFISAEHSTLQFSALKQALASAAPVRQQSSTKPLIRIRTSRELVRLKPTSQQKHKSRSHPPPGHVVARALHLASSPGRVFGCKKGRDIPSKILVAIPDTELDCIMYPSLKNASWLSRWTKFWQMRCAMIHYALCIFRENPKQLVQRCP